MQGRRRSVRLFVLSPLCAVARTIPALFTYDVTAGTGPSLRPDAEQAPIIAYGDALVGYDKPSRLLGDGSGAACAYDDALEHDANRRDSGAIYAYARALEHADGREVSGEMAIYDARTATSAAEAFSTAGRVAQLADAIPARQRGGGDGPAGIRYLGLMMRKVPKGSALSTYQLL